jgi:hypothetical protein
MQVDSSARVEVPPPEGAIASVCGRGRSREREPDAMAPSGTDQATMTLRMTSPASMARKASLT